MTAFTWLNDFARWLAAWVPRLTLIPPTHRAILFGPRGGAVERGPGLVFWWPIAQKMQRIPVVRQTMETCSRMLPIEDEGGIVPVTAVCGLVVEYTIVDPLGAALGTTQLRAIVDNRIQVRFGEEWRSIEDAAGAAERAADGVADALLLEVGVRLDRVGVANVGRAAAVKLIQDWSHQNLDDDAKEEEASS